MSRDAQEDATDLVKSSETLFDVVEYLYRAEGATLAEAAADLAYAKSTIHRHLATLEHCGYVVRDAETYRVGLRFLELGERARNRHQVYQLARGKVDELAAETDERAQFIDEEHGDAVYIHRALGAHAVRTDPGIGRRIPIYSTSAGKALLAFKDDEELDRILERIEFEAITPHTITDPDELHAELDRVRERGYAFNREENLEGLHAVGVPVTNPDGGVAGALSVSGPSHRLTGEWFEEELPTLLLGAANELELNVGHS